MDYITQANDHNALKKSHICLQSCHFNATVLYYNLSIKKCADLRQTKYDPGAHKQS